MKKSLFLCIAALLAAILSCVAYAFPSASDTTYYIDEFGISIDVPSDLIAFTRNMDENDQNLQLYGYTKDEMTSLLTSKRLYFDVWDEDYTFELVLGIEDSDQENYSELGDYEMAEIIDGFLANPGTSNNFTVEKSEFYNNPETNFIKNHLLTKEKQAQGSYEQVLQYYTVQNGKELNIMVYSYLTDGAITANIEATADSIVSGISFGNALLPASSFQATLLPSKPSDTALLKSESYTDNVTGLTFTVPKGLIETASLPDEGCLSSAVFSSASGGSPPITYYSLDLWDSFTFIEKLMYTRYYPLDQMTVLKPEFEQYYSLEQPGIVSSKYVEIGKTTYLKTIMNVSQSYLGDDYNFDYTEFLHVEDWYAYYFSFPGTDKSAYYGSFEEMLETVNYPYPDEHRKSIVTLYRIIDFLFSLLAAFFVYCLPMLLFKHLRKSENPINPWFVSILYLPAAFIILVLLSLWIPYSVSFISLVICLFINLQILKNVKINKSPASDNYVLSSTNGSLSPDVQAENQHSVSIRKDTNMDDSQKHSS